MTDFTAIHPEASKRQVEKKIQASVLPVDPQDLEERRGSI